MQLPSALAAVDKATKAIQYGDKKTALAELTRLKNLILSIQTELNAHQSPTYANTRCPIMGNKIDPAKVTIALTRSFNGQKVAFCCAGCLPQWDKMADSQKSAKLKALAPAETDHDPHDGEDHTGHAH